MGKTHCVAIGTVPLVFRWLGKGPFDYGQPVGGDGAPHNVPNLMEMHALRAQPLRGQLNTVPSTYSPRADLYCNSVALLRKAPHDQGGCGLMRRISILRFSRAAVSPVATDRQRGRLLKRPGPKWRSGPVYLSMAIIPVVPQPVSPWLLRRETLRSGSSSRAFSHRPRVQNTPRHRESVSFPQFSVGRHLGSLPPN